MDQRLITKIDRSGGPDSCWPWLGQINAQGYGVMSFEGKPWRVTRLIYTIEHGPIPSPKHLICHSCDNPPCCNPKHLWLGNHKENGLDMSRKERHSNNKLIGEQVRAIRADNRCTKDIALDYGVHWSNVAAIKAGRTWVHEAGPTKTHRKAKITEDQVRAIRTDKRTGYEIGAEYGLSYNQVTRIRRRERWGHVPD